MFAAPNAGVSFPHALAVLAALLIVVVTYYKWAFGYWKRRNFPYLEPSIPFGTSTNPLTNKLYAGVYTKMMYDAIKGLGHPHAGTYHMTCPIYMPVAPDYVKNVLQDFHHFSERGFYYNERDDPLSANVFSLGGDKWRYLRSKLAPSFTPGKIKMMLGTITQCGEQMRQALGEFWGRGEPIDIKDMGSCFAIDIIGSCVFGLDCNSFRSPDAEFRVQGRKIFESASPFRFAKVLCACTFPGLARRLGVKVFPKECSDFFFGVVRNTVEFRERNGVMRRDMMQLLIEMKNRSGGGGGGGGEPGKGLRGLTMEELTAEAFIFFAAGFETTSTTISFCLYELANNGEIQERAREEIGRVLAKHGGEITYESIHDMKYMQQIVDETLRKYPPASFITRVCTEDYNIPGTELVLEKGTVVGISLLGIQRDPEYWPEPDTFDPDRFSEENKKYIKPFTNIPFGEGPKMCMGIRFGTTQVKVALINLLKEYRFSVNPRTVIPFEMDPFSLTLTTRTGIFLDIEKVM